MFDPEYLKDLQKKDPAAFYTIHARLSKEELDSLTNKELKTMSNVSDRRRIKLEKISAVGYIPFMGGRPERDHIINSDDVNNLVIALNTAFSLEELFEVL